MREIRILFNGPMVRAILEGWKTQTRRLVKAEHISVTGKLLRYPYGERGDRLWVRETWAAADCMYQSHELDTPRVIAYRADKSGFNFEQSRRIPDWDTASWNFDCLKWRPSIFMPRWASRLTLEVTHVRVERLQEISERDACAEGVGSPITRDCKRPKFAALWDEMNDTGAWDANPLVWVIGFRVVGSDEQGGAR